MKRPKNINKRIIVFFLMYMFLPFYMQVQSQEKVVNDIDEIITRGDIMRDAYTDTAKVGLYQGNGRFGCVFGSLGLHIPPEKCSEKETYGMTQFMHKKHFMRGKYGVDYLLPLAKIYWEKEPESIAEYSQNQSFFDGTITTIISSGNDKITLVSWFDPNYKDLAGFKIFVEGKAPNIIVEPLKHLKVHYDQEIEQHYTSVLSKGQWKATIKCQDASSDFIVKTNTKLKECDKGLEISLQEGENTILLSVNSPVSITAEESLMNTKQWWNETWYRTGWMDLPDENAQKVWVRSLAYLLYSFDKDNTGLVPPNGLTGNFWPFPFSQDISYMLPVFLSTGHVDIAKSVVEYFANNIKGMKEYTKRIFKVETDTSLSMDQLTSAEKQHNEKSVGLEGIFSSWTSPYAQYKGFHEPTPPNSYYYQLHNTGYLCRMAYETGVMLNNAEWSKSNVEPLIRETALFFKSICKKEQDGYWHIFIEPSMGQDEYGGFNQKDYLCALYSSEYCFQKAIESGLDKDGQYQKILDEGLAFPSLLSEKGCYFSCQGGGMDAFGNQKHPVQLNALAYLPVNKEVTEPEKIAYNSRYEITDKAKVPYYHGWTLGEFLLAGTRMGDVAGWKKDWSNFFISDYTDSELVQIYEASTLTRGSFYISTHGLFAQSILGNVISTWYGNLEIGNCLPWKTVRFGNIKTLLGIEVSGEIRRGNALLEIEAWKDCEFKCRGKEYNLKKGEKMNLHLSL